MLYRDEKLKQIVRRQMQFVWQTAAASRERTLWLGGLAVLAWTTCVVQLPPVQRSRSAIPHVVAICAAYSIAATMKENLKKASNTQKSVIDLAKSLRVAQTSDELHQIHQELGKLENQFVFKANRQKE